MKLDDINKKYNNCLITGGNGYLGRHIYTQLKTNNYQISTLGRRKDNNYIFDLAVDVPKFTETFDFVVHCAGKAHSYPTTEKEKQKFFDVNVKGTENLLQALASLPSLPKFFVFISSVSVYGLIEGELINEHEPLHSDYPYGLSKIKAEQEIMEWCKAKNVICLILRLPLLAGKNPPGNLKMMIDSIKKGYYFNNSRHSVRKSIVMASDVAKIIQKSLGVGGIFNLSDGYHPTFDELANLIAKQLSKGKAIKVPKWAIGMLIFLTAKLHFLSPNNAYKFKKITSNLTFDDSKARKELGWNPSKVLDNFEIS